MSELETCKQLLIRSMNLLNKWNLAYGVQKCKWLPPAGYVELGNDFDEFKRAYLAKRLLDELKAEK
jgi:hypothetical protein